MMNSLSIETLKEIESEFGDFQVKQVMGGTNDVYLRFGYWRRVNIGKLQEIIGNGIKVVEDDDYDDDCGYQFMFRLK
jgi:hypothetical protein